VGNLNITERKLPVKPSNLKTDCVLLYNNKTDSKSTGQWQSAVSEQVHTSWFAISDTKTSAQPPVSVTRSCSAPCGASPLMTLVDDAGYSPR